MVIRWIICVIDIRERTYHEITEVACNLSGCLVIQHNEFSPVLLGIVEVFADKQMR